MSKFKTVADLIAELQTFSPDTPVGRYIRYSRDHFPIREDANIVFLEEKGEYTLGLDTFYPVMNPPEMDTDSTPNYYVGEATVEEIQDDPEDAYSVNALFVNGEEDARLLRADKPTEILIIGVIPANDL